MCVKCNNYIFTSLNLDLSFADIDHDTFYEWPRQYLNTQHKLLQSAEQVHLGDGTETLSTRIWINNKPLLLHNLYRVDGDLDITTPLTIEPRSIMVGDFNARDERWCRANNRAGRLLNEQIQDLDNFCLMNHPQVWTTVNKTVIDLSLVPVGMAPLTSWSIYPGLLSDHLAVLLEIRH